MRMTNHYTVKYSITLFIPYCVYACFGQFQKAVIKGIGQSVLTPDAAECKL